MSTMTNRSSGWGGRLLVRGRMVLGALGVSVALSGCATGAYPLDIFPEMHYGQNYRAQEGPRIEAPIDSVPREGKPVPVDLGSAATMKSTVSNTPDTVQTGMALYGRNCAICHGPAGKGDGRLTAYFQTGKDNKGQDGSPVLPIDLTSPRGRIWSAGEGGGLYSIITNGQGQWMPPFRALLTEDERWLIVQAVKNIQAQATAAAAASPTPGTSATPAR